VNPWLAAAYAALALGLAWSLAGGPGWRRRAAYAVCAPPLAFALWVGRPDPAGWPASGKVPRESSLVSAVVDEPDPATGDRGHIYLWLDVGAAAPRAYSLPYSRALHEQVQHALDELKHGHGVALAQGQGGGGHERVPLRLFPHPPPGLPAKAGEN